MSTATASLMPMENVCSFKVRVRGERHYHRGVGYISRNPEHLLDSRREDDGFVSMSKYD